ncbi:MAG: TonB-dependent receptor, partial [Marinomonas gallaica]
MEIKTFLVTPLTAVIAVSSAAHGAQEAPISDRQNMMNPIMIQDYKGYAQELPTSGSKSDAEWLDVPQSVSVVTNTEMEDRGAVRLVDALDGVAGVNNTLGEGSRDQFVIRGFDAIRDVYRDGLRDDGNLQSYRSLANVEQVEVVKGPAGALYGRGSAGGIINLVTKRANGDEFTRLGTSYGSHDQVTGSIDSSTQLTDTVNGRINAEIRQSNSFVDHVDSEDYFIAP